MSQQLVVGAVVGGVLGIASVVATALLGGGPPSKPTAPVATQNFAASPGGVSPIESAGPEVVTSNNRSSIAPPLAPGSFDTPTANPWDWLRWESLDLGMSRAEVERMLGEPVEETRHGNQWQFEKHPESKVNRGNYWVHFSDDLVDRWEARELPVTLHDVATYNDSASWVALTVSISTKNDVIAALGRPSEYSTSQNGTTYYYGFPGGLTRRAVFSQRGILEKLDLGD